MSEIQISQAEQSDLDSILAINQHFSYLYSHEESYLQQQIAAGRVFLARSGEQVVGYLIYELIWGNTPFLALIRVLPEFQRKGIGSALFKELERALKQSGFKALVGSSTAGEIGNEFQVKMGFKKIGTLPLI